LAWHAQIFGKLTAEAAEDAELRFLD